MISKSYSDILFQLWMLTNAFRNICILFCWYTVASVLFYFLYALTALFCVSILLHMEKIKINLFTMTAFVATLLLIAVPTISGIQAWLYQGYNALSILLTFLLLIASGAFCLTERKILFCYKIYVLQAIAVVVMSLIPSSYEDGVLLLHMGNPNQTAMFLWFIFSFCFLFWRRKKHARKVSIGLWILMILILVGIFFTKSRTALLSSFVCIFYALFRKNKNLPRLLKWVFFTAPLTVPALILFIQKIFPKQIILFGKMLFSGREVIWKKVWDEFCAHPFSEHLQFTPDYFAVLAEDGSIVTKAVGAHNVLLGLQWKYGAVVTFCCILLLWILYRRADKYSKECVNSRTVFVVIAATFLYSSFEEGVLLGNLSFTFNFSLYFMICRSEALIDRSKNFRCGNFMRHALTQNEERAI